MSWMRGAGTCKALARAYDDMPRGFKNSSRNISPGWMAHAGGPLRCMDIVFSSFSVIIHDFDIECIMLNPYKTDSKLFVDSDTMVPCSVSCQGFQTVSWRHSKIV